MKAAEYLVDVLVRLGVTDVFGIPGGVVLDFLYALNKREEIHPRLCCHEQCAAFAAAGFAQAGGKLGAAYATKGPGIANMLTPIADAYSDSIPMLVITAHTEHGPSGHVRFIGEQELDTVGIFSSVTKYVARIDFPDMFASEIEKACRIALTGRQGPVLVDVRADIWEKDVLPVAITKQGVEASTGIAASVIQKKLKTARRPILLIGDGIHQAKTEIKLKELAERAGIPVLSSRCALDIMPQSSLYFGYIGSHGIRCANFVLSKADLIIALGNRLSFPVNSASFRPMLERAEVLWVEVDAREAARRIPNCTCIQEDVADTLNALSERELTYEQPEAWMAICQELKTDLQTVDKNQPVQILEGIFQQINKNTVIVCDVGNNEFWASRAYLAAKIENRLLFSKSFGALGCALGKSIGVYYATKKHVLCVVGDQGLQLNSQELQVIGKEQLPVIILVMNNRSSGMIRDRERQKFGDYFLHTTEKSGYSVPDFRSLAQAYGIEYIAYSQADSGRFSDFAEPVLIEVQISEECTLEPCLPRGNSCQDMMPALPGELFEILDQR